MKRITPSIMHETILTNDPSMRAWGWSVLSLQGRVIVSGGIQTSPTDKKLRIRKGDDLVRRVSLINNNLLSIIEIHNVKFIVSELPHGSQSASAAVMIGAVTGIMQTIGDCLDIPVEWFSEADAKAATFGRTGMTKDDMVKKISTLYPTVEVRGVKWIDQAVADSLAVHYVAMQQSSVLRMMKK